VATPTDADILNAIGALNRRLQQITKNQQTIESKLNHLATRVAAADANLIMGV
jgi:prefoldin subunit 5